jgi:rubrerythrin
MKVRNPLFKAPQKTYIKTVNTTRQREHDTLYFCPKCRHVWVSYLDPDKRYEFYDLPTYGKPRKDCPMCRKDNAFKLKVTG